MMKTRIQKREYLNTNEKKMLFQKSVRMLKYVKQKTFNKQSILKAMHNYRTNLGV